LICLHAAGTFATRARARQGSNGSQIADQDAASMSVTRCGARAARKVIGWASGVRSGSFRLGMTDGNCEGGKEGRKEGLKPKSQSPSHIADYVTPARVGDSFRHRQGGRHAANTNKRPEGSDPTAPTTSSCAILRRRNARSRARPCS
jgi:hypothetical protein